MDSPSARPAAVESPSGICYAEWGLLGFGMGMVAIPMFAYGAAKKNPPPLLRAAPQGIAGVVPFAHANREK